MGGVQEHGLHSACKNSRLYCADSNAIAHVTEFSYATLMIWNFTYIILITQIIGCFTQNEITQMSSRGKKNNLIEGWNCNLQVITESVRMSTPLNLLMREAKDDVKVYSKC